MERQLPKNVRQIGNVSDTPKVYVEDYVDTYLNQLKEKAKDHLLSGGPAGYHGTAAAHPENARRAERAGS